MLKQIGKMEYDSQLKAKVITGLVMRLVIASYIVYLAWKVLSGMLNGGSPIPTFAVIIICIFFLGCAIAFCVYAWKAYKKALKAAVLEAQSNSKE